MVATAPQGSTAKRLRFRRFGGLPNGHERLTPLLSATRIQPVSAWRWDCSEQWEQFPRTVPDVMWFCIEEGTGWCRFGEDLEAAEKHALGPGDLFLIPRAAQHHVKPDSGVAFRLYTIHFFADLYGTVDLIGALGMGGVYRGKPGGLFTTTSFDLARENALRATGYQQSMVALIWRLLLHLIREHGRKLQLGKVGELEKLTPVLDLVDDRLEDPNLKVSELAAAMHVSEVYLRKLFAAVLGVSPVTFLRLRRVERASVLLKSTDLPIKRIAGECGFNELPFFYRTFKRITGTTPQAYRQAVEV